jgi:adenine phosphoribosyltransferase
MTSNKTDLPKDLATAFRSVPDFPKPGIIFRDIGPVLNNPVLWKRTVQDMATACRDKQITKVVGMDARGFLVGIPVAMELGVGFVMARKPSKLPGEKWSVSYGLEYGKDCLEMSKDLIQPGDRVLVVDDLLATGGTADAAAKLVACGGGSVVSYAFIVELTSLQGRQKLAPVPVYSCCVFD